MEIFKQLPLELKYYIMYNCNGIENPLAKIMKEFIKENNLYKTEQFKEPNFYEFLKICKILKRQIHLSFINEYNSNGELIGQISYPNNQYFYGYDSSDEEDDDDHIA